MFSDMWWSIWWGPLLLWLVAVTSAAALGTVVVREVLRRKRLADLNLTHSICFYLHNPAVMDLYKVNRYAEAITQEVEQRTNDSGEVGAGKAGLTVRRQRGRERVEKYVRESSPIDVIGIIVNTLERENAIVHVNLVKETVRPNGALTRTLAASDRTDSGTVRLRDVEDYVLLRARFRTAAQDPNREPDETIFLAPYGNPDNPALAPRVRVTCATEGLRSDMRRGTFPARCLGKVEDWNAEDGVLEVRAIAIFL